VPTDSYRFTLQKDLTYAVEITAPNTLHKIVRGFATLREAEAWLSHQKIMAAIAARSGATHEGGAMIATRAPRRYR
jgi:hypothetical protein